MVLDNARKLVMFGAKVVFRVPLIPDMNDTSEAVEQLSRFFDEINVQEIQLLPYHKLGEGKLKSINTNRQPIEVIESDKDEIEKSGKYYKGQIEKLLLGGVKLNTE